MEAPSHHYYRSHEEANICEEEMFGDEYDEYEEEPDILIARPAAAFTSRPPIQYRPPPVHELTPPPSPERQQSPAAFKFPPMLSRAATTLVRTPSRSPQRSTAYSTQTSEADQIPSDTMKSKASKAASSFADFFHGSSAPVNLGFIPSPKKETLPEGSPFGSPTRPGQHRRSSTLQTAASFLGFASKTSLARPSRINEDDQSDPFLNLDLENELFPSGRGTQHSASAYDDLLANSERLFFRMNAAYKMKHDNLQTAATTANIEQDELDEARHRASHLKLQLDSMSAKVEKQEDAIKTLTHDLDEEKKMRLVEKEARRRSIRLVNNSPQYMPRFNVQREKIFSRENSQGMHFDAEDSGDETTQDSVFSSRPGSASASSVSAPGSEDMWTQQRPTTFAGLREENLRLMARINELEETVNGCLGLVGSI